ncbi:MAG TPA: glycosyltransferase 87 family protein, partial [Actinomycetota bacterium]|nr:glycosyltransferase 87 family protein [Actinomycetota bacterium]
MEPSGHRAAAPIGLGLVLLCLLGTLLVGSAHKELCAEGNWSDGRQYRWWCYSDIVPLFGTEQLAEGRLPFLDECAPAENVNCDEYPVLTMYFMRGAASLWGDNVKHFFYANEVLLGICAGITALCLYLLVGGRRTLYFALAPTLLLGAFVNWDLFAVALATGALLAFLNRRDGWAGVLLGLGAATKLYPVLFVVPFVAHRLREREPDRAIG